VYQGSELRIVRLTAAISRCRCQDRVCHGGKRSTLRHGESGVDPYLYLALISNLRYPRRRQRYLVRRLPSLPPAHLSRLLSTASHGGGRQA
jgi:hypothetical protein